MATLPRFSGARGETLRSATVKLRPIWYWGAVAISAVFLVGTFVSHLPSSKGFFLQKLALTQENNPAALWSGLLMALAAVHAYDGFALWRRRQVEVARAWAVIALLLLFLSADEIGSVHERMSHLGDWLGIGHWWPLLPFAIVLSAMLGYALVLLWRAEGQRSIAGVVLLGFFLLGTVALQEYVEHRIAWDSTLAKATRALVEEGVELLGVLILLRVALLNTAFSDRRGFAAWPCLEACHELRIPVIMAALLLAPILAVGTATSAEHLQGRLADWLAVVLLLGAALAACRPYLRGGEVGWPAWVLAATCGVAALIMVEMEPDRIVRLGSLAVSMRLLALCMIAPVVIAMWGLLHGRRWTWLYLFSVAVMAELLVLSFLSVGATAIYLVSQLLALGFYVAHVAMAQGGAGARQPLTLQTGSDQRLASP